MTEPTFTAFEGQRHLVSGDLPSVLREVFARRERAMSGEILIFDDGSGKQADFDWRGSADDVLKRALLATRKGPGRPKLGVTAKEVTLLPRHWEWLDGQPGGASATLRRLIDAERKRPEEAKQRARSAADRFILSMAGNLAGYQEAARALYASDEAAFRQHTRAWPADIQRHAHLLAAPAFEGAAQKGV